MIPISQSFKFKYYENRNGKVYVSMENKLLFESGSWTVGTEGKKAVKLVGDVLGQNPDISVLIEGHTDNDKITGTIGGGVENNWDLSTKRATAIVNILSENKAIASSVAFFRFLKTTIFPCDFLSPKILLVLE